MYYLILFFIFICLPVGCYGKKENKFESFYRYYARPIQQVEVEKVKISNFVIYDQLNGKNKSDILKVMGNLKEKRFLLNEENHSSYGIRIIKKGEDICSLGFYIYDDTDIGFLGEFSENLGPEYAKIIENKNYLVVQDKVTKDFLIMAMIPNHDNLSFVANISKHCSIKFP